jgi:hypothetical protein
LGAAGKPGGNPLRRIRPGGRKAGGDCGG